MAIAICPLAMAAALSRADVGDVPPTPDLARFDTRPYSEFAVGHAGHKEGGWDDRTTEYTLETGVPVWRSIHVVGVMPWASTTGGELIELGNVGVEVTTRHARKESRGGWRMGGGVRVWLPTATGYRLTRSGRNVLNTAHHVYDPGRFAPFTLTVRPGVALARVADFAFVQADAGADIFLPTDEAETAAEDEFGYHAGVAAGPILGPFAGYVELAYFRCATCGVDPVDYNETDTLGLEEQPPPVLVVGIRASFGPMSMGFAIRRHLGTVPFLDGVPYRLDINVRF